MEFLGVKKVQKLKKFKIVQVVTSTYSKILSTFFFVSVHFNNSSDVVRITIYDYLYLVTVERTPDNIPRYTNKTRYV